MNLLGASMLAAALTGTTVSMRVSDGAHKSAATSLSTADAFGPMSTATGLGNETFGAVVKAARSRLNATVADGGDALQSSATFSASMIKVASKIYQEVTETMHLPEHALLLAGSGGRYEMATYSDLEYLVVFDAKCPTKEGQGSFERKVLKKFRAKLIEVGLESDALNQPAFIKKTIACSTDDLVGDLLMRGDQVSTSMVLETTWLAGSQRIAATVRDAVSKWLALPAAEAAAQGHPKISVRKRLAASNGTLRDFVVDELKLWKFGSSMADARRKAESGLAESGSFNIKSVLYRPLQDILAVSSWISNAPTNADGIGGAFNSQSRLDFLQSQDNAVARRVWSAELTKSVRDALEAVTRARIYAHAAAESENNDVCFSCSSKDVYKLPEELHKPLQRAAEIVVCLVRAVDSDDPNAFPPSSC